MIFSVARVAKNSAVESPLETGFIGFQTEFRRGLFQVADLSVAALLQG